MQKGISFLGLCLLLLLWAAPLAAQEGVTWIPTQLTLAGQRGQVETRTLLLRSAEGMTGLRAVPLDLERATPGVVFPAERITVALPADHIAAGDVMTTSITIDLRNAHSGEFSGTLLLHYDSGVLNIPLTVTVKDPPYLAFGVLLLGVVVGVSVSAYRTQGRPRDKILAQVGQYRAQMKADAELMNAGKPLHERIEAGLVDVDVALEGQNWNAANEALAQVTPLWLGWRKHRVDWVAQLAYYTDLHKQVGESNTTYTKTLLKAAQDLHRSLGLEEPQVFANKLNALTERFNAFAAFQTRIEALASSDRDTAQRLQAQLHSLAYDDQPGVEALETTLNAALAATSDDNQGSELEMMPKGSNVPRDGSAGRGILSTPITIVRALMGAPEVQSRTPDAQKEKAAKGAAGRLKWFKLGTYAISVALLAGAGFGELYINNNAFGATPWGHYFALLAWGFGAEASRAAITDLVKTWGVGE